MVETLSPEWVTGFVDADGCFGIYAYRRNRKGQSPMVSAEFSIQLREDDEAVLQQIQTYFNCGHINKNSRAKMRREGHTNARDQVSFKVRRLDDLVEHVIPHFDRHLPRSKKLRDYLIWREAVMILSARHLRFKKWANSKKARAVMLAKVLRLSSDLRQGRNPGLRRSPQDMVA